MDVLMVVAVAFLPGVVTGVVLVPSLHAKPSRDTLIAHYKPHLHA